MAFQHLKIQIEPSKVLIIFVVFLYLALMSIVLMIHLGVVFKIALMLGVGYSAYHHWQRVWLKTKEAIVILYFKDGSWWGIDRCQNRHDYCLLGESYISRFLIILHFQEITTRKRSVIMLPRDAVNAQTFNRLMVVLRWI